MRRFRYLYQIIVCGGSCASVTFLIINYKTIYRIITNSDNIRISTGTELILNYTGM